MAKANTQSTKQLLETALQSLPVNRHTSDVRTHIHRAINEIERVEKKEFRKAQQQAKLTPSEKWQLDLETGQLVNPLSPQMQLNLLGQIDEMISAEKKKLDDINQRKSPPEEGETLMG